MGIVTGLLRDPRGRWLVALPVLAVVAALVGFWIHHAVNELDPPSAAASQHELELGVAADVHQSVRARCQRPTARGWICLLRAGDGRYGYASARLSGTTHRIDVPRGQFTYTTTDTTYSWGFYVGRDGVSDTVARPTGADSGPDAPGLVEVIAYGSAANAAVSVGAQRPDLTAVHCPALSVGATVVCTGGPAATRIERTAAGRYRIRMREPLPGTAGYRTDTALPRPGPVPG